MNINTSPTQLALAVVLGESGRGEEEAPLVRDVAIDEDEDDDDIQQYLNTGAYSGFERHESVPELPPPEAERIIDDVPPKKHRKRARKGNNKADAMIQPPLQPRVQDRIPIPSAAKYHIPGEPILPKASVEAIHGDLRRLHDDVLWERKASSPRKIQDSHST